MYATSLEGRWLSRWQGFCGESDIDATDISSFTCPVKQANIFSGRGWRWDFAFIKFGSYVAAVEIQGASGRTAYGGKTIGRHQRVAGMQQDFEKNNALAAMGIPCFYFCAPMILNDSKFREQAELILKVLTR